MQRVDIDTWEVVDMKPMRTGKEGIEVVYFDRKIYAFGNDKNPFEW